VPIVAARGAAFGAALRPDVAYCRQEIVLRLGHFAAINRQIAGDLVKFAAICVDVVLAA